MRDELHRKVHKTLREGRCTVRGAERRYVYHNILRNRDSHIWVVSLRGYERTKPVMTYTPQS